MSLCNNWTKCEERFPFKIIQTSLEAGKLCTSGPKYVCLFILKSLIFFLLDKSLIFINGNWRRTKIAGRSNWFSDLLTPLARAISWLQWAEPIAASPNQAVNGSALSTMYYNGRSSRRAEEEPPKYLVPLPPRLGGRGYRRPSRFTRRWRAVGPSRCSPSRHALRPAAPTPLPREPG